MIALNFCYYVCCLPNVVSIDFWQYKVEVEISSTVVYLYWSFKNKVLVDPLHM